MMWIVVSPHSSPSRQYCAKDSLGQEAQIGSLLSPWKLSASAAVTSFVLQHIGRRLMNPSTKDQAGRELADLVERLMHENITAEEADFISEMAKGVSTDVAAKASPCEAVKSDTTNPVIIFSS